jgi:alpha-glucosidase
MKKISVLLLMMISCGGLFAQSYHLTSPDKNIKVNISTKDSITYSVTYKNTMVMLPSAISLSLDKGVLGKSAKVNNLAKSTVNNTLHPLYGKAATLQDNYNQVVLNFNNNFSLIFRVYNEGMAYRFVTGIKDYQLHSMGVAIRGASSHY